MLQELPGPKRLSKIFAEDFLCISNLTYVAAIDQCLNESAYIVPRVGDAGDRLFGTKE